MTDLREKLLGCPFCGGEAEMSHYAKGTSPTVAGYYVECSSCSAGGEPFDIHGEMPDREEYTKVKAIAAWNTRAPVAAPTGDVLETAIINFMVNDVDQKGEQSEWASVTFAASRALAASLTGKAAT